jgi:hypothetical protein
MPTDWLDYEPGRPFTREQVTAAQRPAWAGGGEAGSTIYYFDGHDFFCRPLSGGQGPVSVRGAPEVGWRHRQGCRCLLCRVAA